MQNSAGLLTDIEANRQSGSFQELLVCITLPARCNCQTIEGDWKLHFLLSCLHFSQAVALGCRHLQSCNNHCSCDNQPPQKKELSTISPGLYSLAFHRLILSWPSNHSQSFSCMYSFEGEGVHPCSAPL